MQPEIADQGLCSRFQVILMNKTTFPVTGLGIAFDMPHSIDYKSEVIDGVGLGLIHIFAPIASMSKLKLQMILRGSKVK
jgi:hypothetical protein